MTSVNDDISYEFNTDGFYNHLSDQLYANSNVLHKICMTATKRLGVKRIEYKALSLTMTTSSRQTDEEKIDLSNLQMVKVKSPTKEKEDKSTQQLSNLYVVSADNAHQPKISPLDSFVNTDFFNEQSIENDKDKENPIENVEMTKAITKNPMQSTGDDVVDSLLMKLSSHMTI